VSPAVLPRSVFHILPEKSQSGSGGRAKA
jgi:hypothetical protein